MLAPPFQGLLENTDSLGLCLLKINILGKRLIVISYTKLWFEASSLNSCIATKGYKFPPLLNFKKCYIESAYSCHKQFLIYCLVNLNIANFFEFTVPLSSCLYGKTRHILVDRFPMQILPLKAETSRSS